MDSTTHEFWSNKAKLHKIPPFWKPHIWHQVKVGDTCILNGEAGVIVHADISARRAVVSIDGTEFVVRKLSELRVPVSRIEERI